MIGRSEDCRRSRRSSPRRLRGCGQRRVSPATEGSRSSRWFCRRPPPVREPDGCWWRRRRPDAARPVPWTGRGCGARSCRRWRSPRGSGQQARTQSMKQAAKRSGSIRFIMMLSQRPEGTPQSKGRNRCKNSRWACPQSEMASKLSHSAIVAQTHRSIGGVLARFPISVKLKSLLTQGKDNNRSGIHRFPKRRRRCAALHPHAHVGAGQGRGA